MGAIRLLMRLCVSGLFATSPVGNLRDPQTRVAILPFSLGASPIGVVAFLLLRGVAIDADGRRASSCMGRRITCGRGARYRSVERRVTVLSLGTFQKLLHLEPAFDLGPYTFDYLHISCVLTQYSASQSVSRKPRIRYSDLSYGMVEKGEGEGLP